LGEGDEVGGFVGEVGDGVGMVEVDFSGSGRAMVPKS